MALIHFSFDIRAAYFVVAIFLCRQWKAADGCAIAPYQDNHELAEGIILFHDFSHVDARFGICHLVAVQP